MKLKFFLSVVVILFFFLISSNAFCFESLIQAQTGPGGGFRSTMTYFASGTGADTGIAYESRAMSSISGRGSFPNVTIYNAAAGAISRQEEVVIDNGHINAETRVGLNTLVTYPDPADSTITRGLLTETAAGTGAVLNGQGVYASVFNTAGGVVMETQTIGLFSNATLRVGAIQRVTEGFGPTNRSAAGERGSTVTEYFEEHHGASAFAPRSAVSIGFRYGVSFNPSVPIVPIVGP